MSNSIGNILLQRFKDFQKDPKQAEQFFKAKGVEHNKRWNHAVGCFMERINKERIRDGFKPLPFMSYRSKMAALVEIDDCKWFWYHCLKTSKIKDERGNYKYTFGQIFWSSLDCKPKKK